MLIILLQTLYFFNLLTYYVSSIMYYINIVIDYKRYILIIILMIYNISKHRTFLPIKTFIRNCTLNLPQECVHNFTYMIGLTKRSHVAPKMQHDIVTASFDSFCVLRNASTQCAE